MRSLLLGISFILSSVVGVAQTLPSETIYFTTDRMSVPKFYYYAKDHLGNIRSVATKTNGVVEEVQHTAYYPFGGIIANSL